MKIIYNLNPAQVYQLPMSNPNWIKVYKYAKLMEQGIVFPPVNIYFDKKLGKWNYNDGRHRVMAAKMTEIELKVKSTKKMGK